MFSRLALIVFSFVWLSGCAHNDAPFNPTIGPPNFRDWCRRSLNQSSNAAEQKLFRQAYGGVSDAIEAYFHKAHAIQMSNQMHPADEEFLSWIVTTLLYRRGDHQFSALLAQESPEIRAAVAKFIATEYLTARYPETQKLFQNAPRIEFPLDRVYRRNDG